jgi:sugar phosphate isomerase/epimerase
MPPPPSLKQAFPFRLGTTSYLLPAEILPNVEYLAPLVDDVELVLFESDELSNLPDAPTVARLAALAAAHDLTYTVHFPLDADLASPDEDTRQRSVGKCRRIVETVGSLAPFAYLLHLPPPPEGGVPARRPWQARLEQSLEALLAAGLEPRRLCAETLAYPFAYAAPLVERYDLSVCLDIGHLLLGGYSLPEHLTAYLPRCRVLHLHGVIAGADHRDLTGLHPADLEAVLHAASSEGAAERVVTLEVFSQPDFERSLEVLRPHLPCPVSSATPSPARRGGRG